MKFVVSTIGDPYDSRTYSGVPYRMFRALDRRGLILKRINGKMIEFNDHFDGYWDLKRTILNKKPYREALWRYRHDVFYKLSSRINAQLVGCKYDVFFQIGVGGLPDSECIKVAHVELPLKYAISDPIFSESYGFGDKSESLIKSALQGEQLFLNKCDILWTNTQWTKSLLEGAGVSSDKIFVYPPCLESQKTYQVVENIVTPKLLFIGKDWKRKGGDVLLESFSDIIKIYPDATLDIVGCSPEVNQAGVRVHGFLKNDNSKDQEILNEVYSRVNIFCMPSHWETTGIVYFEAMQRGLPVIMKSGQGREHLFGGYASIIREVSVSEVTAAILDLVGREDIGSTTQKAMLFVNENFTYDIFIERLLEFISKKIISY